MQYNIINVCNLPVNRWAGGTTTEMFIFSPTASYKERNFMFRISTAKVEIPQSDFTMLPGFWRKLMVLDGEIIITHQDRYTKKLQKFDTDDFDGAWQTSSQGMCTDFNVMTSSGATAAWATATIQSQQIFEYKIQEATSWMFLYVLSGKIACSSLQNAPVMQELDFMSINQPLQGMFQLQAIENSELVIVEIKTNI